MTQPPEKPAKTPKRHFKPPITLLIIAVLVFYVGSKALQDPGAAWNTFINIGVVVLGFGAVIFVHELGHFIAAKSVGIMVEGFSLGFGPIVVSFRKVRGGLGIRILPSLIPGRDGEGALMPVIPLPFQKEGETEYRLNLIPLGGFVKMLGQEDIASDKPSDDPRAYPNKAVWQRSIVIAAGVIMNVICGAMVFIFIFAQGMEMPPPVVGDILPHSPAARAGIRAGDVITAIDGAEPFGFASLRIAAALSREDQKVILSVKHPDGATEDISLAAEVFSSTGRKSFGVDIPFTLTLAKDIQEESYLEELAKMNFKPGDTIVALNGEPVSGYYQLSEVWYPLPGRSRGESVTLTVERIDSAGQVTRHQVDIPLVLADVGPKGTSGQVLGLVPRIQVVGLDEKFPETAKKLMTDDIILRIGTVSNPTIEEMQSYCAAHKDQPVELLVQRVTDGQVVEKLLEITPQFHPDITIWVRLFGKPKARLGCLTSMDYEHTVVADVQPSSIEQHKDLGKIPRGAQIMTVAGEPVSNWRDMVNIMTQNRGEDIDFTFRSAPDQPEQSVGVTVPKDTSWLGFAYRPDLGGLAYLPLEAHMEIYQGANWRECLGMGVNRCYTMLAITYLSLKGMIQGSVSFSEVSGPVGILKMSYTIAEEKNLLVFLDFMAIISICVAFFNFLPIPVLDGGHMVMLIVEKIKGSPVSLRAQEIASYAGLIIILGIFALVTFNDIIKVFTDQI